MLQYGINGYLFKDVFEGDEIFDKYKSFISWYNMLPSNKNSLWFINRNLKWEDIKNNIVIEDDGTVIYRYQTENNETVDKKLDCPRLQTFSLLFNNYSDNHIASSLETFKMHFTNILDTYFKEYENTTKAIDKLMDLKEEDIATDYSTILNIANIPETESTTNQEEVNFISQQQKTISKKGKLQISKEILASKKAYTTRTFLNRFKYLFIKIISSGYNLLYENETEV